MPVPREEAARAVAPLTLEALAGLGLLRSGDQVEALVDLVPTEDLLIASDRFRDELEQADHVLGLSPPTRVLSCLTPRRHVGSVLDLGTGNGLQAILASRHADRVIATDINERAVRFAAFNAVLNDAPNVVTVQGNLFEPVEGETFDVLVCNPPYVVSPETALLYRDSGLRGDSFCEGLVREVPAFLNDGGLAVMLLAWIHPRDGDWSQPVRSWLEGGACDSILLRYATHDPLSYAAGWNRPRRPDPAAYGDALDTWLEYYRALGVEAISWGALVLRRRQGENWTWTYSPSSDRLAPAGEHVLRLIAAQDRLAGLTDNELLDDVLALADDHRLEQTVVLAGGEGTVQQTRLRLEAGLRTEIAVDGPTVHVISLLDGATPLRQVLETAADRAVHDGMRSDDFERAALRAVRRLVELGFVLTAA